MPKKAKGEIARAKRLPEILLGPEDEEAFVLELRRQAAMFAASARQPPLPEITLRNRITFMWRRARGRLQLQKTVR